MIYEYIATLAHTVLHYTKYIFVAVVAAATVAIVVVVVFILRSGPQFNIKIWHLTSIGNPIVEIRRPYDRLISKMGFPILARWHLYIESGPRTLSVIRMGWQHYTTSNIGCQCVTDLRVNARQVTFTDIIPYTFGPRLSGPSSLSDACNRYSDRFNTGNTGSGMLYMSRPSEPLTARDNRNILNAKFLQ